MNYDLVAKGKGQRKFSSCDRSHRVSMKKVAKCYVPLLDWTAFQPFFLSQGALGIKLAAVVSLVE